jgi:esterase FrsA
MAAVRKRERTVDEVKAFLRERLATRGAPLNFADEEQANAALERLDGIDGERWAAAWGAAGALFEDAAQAAEARDHSQVAGDCYFQAYNFYFIGRFPCPNHPRKLECYAKARENFVKAGRYFDPPLQRVVLPFAGRADEGQEVVFYVRKPKGVARPPVLLRWGGIDTWKEERNDLNDRFLQEGYATVNFDMPGTGESPVLGSPDGERQYTPVFEWLRAQPDLDGSRIGCLGMSFGGYWATKLAHTHREYLTAVVNWGGGIHGFFQPEWLRRSRYADSYLMELGETRARIMGLPDYETYMERAHTLSLLDQRVLDQPSAPLLLVNGKEDRQAPIDDLYLVLEHGSVKSARVFPGGHMGHTPQTFPTILNWLRDRLTAGAPSVQR